MRSTSLRPCPEGLGNLLKTHRDGDILLQLLIFNEESLVSASHQQQTSIYIYIYRYIHMHTNKT